MDSLDSADSPDLRPPPATGIPSAAQQLAARRAQLETEFEAHAAEFRGLLIELARTVLVAKAATRTTTSRSPEPVSVTVPDDDSAVAGTAALVKRTKKERRALVRRVAAMVAMPAIVAASLLFVRLGYVTSGSMRPHLPVGGLVVSIAVPSDNITRGDIITFTPPGGTNRVTHRVYEVRYRRGHPVWFITKGDANPVPDSWQVQAHGRAWKEVLVVPGLGRTLAYLGRPVPKFVLELTPLYLVAALVLLRVWRNQSGGRLADEPAV